MFKHLSESEFKQFNFVDLVEVVRVVIDSFNMEDLIEEYQSSLEDLTFNSKPHINMLTILAEENKQHAELIVRRIEARLAEVNVT